MKVTISVDDKTKEAADLMARFIDLYSDMRNFVKKNKLKVDFEYFQDVKTAIGNVASDGLLDEFRKLRKKG